METLKTALNEIVLGNKEKATETPTQPIWHPTEKMKALVYYGKEDIRYVDHPRPCITSPTDALLRVTATTVCGSDLHLYKGTFMGMRKGDIPGHEFMGIIEEVGSEVSKFKAGDRVIVSFAISCGKCEYCEREEYTSCSTNNPARTTELVFGEQSMAAYGYSHLTGAVPGGQAEYVRVMLADQNCMRVPDSLPDEKALFLTDIIPTSYHGAICGEVSKGKTVGIWGLGPIGLMCAQWCKKLGASRVIGIDTVPERLALARDRIGIDVIDFREHDVVAEIHRMLGGGRGGLDVGIEYVGFDFPQSWLHKLQMKLGLETDSPEIFTEIFRCVRNSGNVAMIGDYYAFANHFPIGIMMEKGLVVKGGQCPVIKYWPHCMKMLERGEIDPTLVVSDTCSLADGPLIYARMARHEAGCIKAFLRPEHSRTTDRLEREERAQELTPRESDLPNEEENFENRPPMEGKAQRHENISGFGMERQGEKSAGMDPTWAQVAAKGVVTESQGSGHEQMSASERTEILEPGSRERREEMVFPSGAREPQQPQSREEAARLVFPTSAAGPEIYAATK